uniref:Uncharacterized protein n=1 Tax=Moniliophthora roreri TaxID=221103 RepID=A0A0W0G9T1_MONRR
MLKEHLVCSVKRSKDYCSRLRACLDSFTASKIIRLESFILASSKVICWSVILVKPTADLELSEAIGGDGGNTVRDSINAVTIESIAYIACQAFFMLTTHNIWSHTDLLNGKKILWIGGTDIEVLQLADSIGNKPEEGSDMALALAQAAAEAAAAAEANVTATNPTPSDSAHSTQAT